MTTSSSRAERLVADVTALLPTIAARAERCKDERRVPDDTVAELQQIGFFLALQPARYGGLELMPQDFFRAQMALAEACMSTAWACGIVAVHAYQLALMDDLAQQEVWGGDIHTRISSSYAPMGKVEVVDGGFQFSGRWGWSSGCDHCSWVLLGGIVPDEGYRTFLIPRTDYEIVDTWQVMGLQGTGSNDIVVRGTFVPEHRT
ncbi:acyl-CoA dehydrogenase family protein, partial [Litorivivens sp.]